MPRKLDIEPDRLPATQQVRAGVSRSGFEETSEALYMTSGFVYPSAAAAEAAFLGENERYIYSRFSNPTVTMFETRLASLEGASCCRATASGMSAVFGALASMLRAGDRLVASRALFGSCHVIVSQILPSFGVQTTLVDGRDAEQWRQALAEPASCVFIESPSNPTLELIDIRALCELAHEAGARVVVDNVFATPLLQKPLALGADVVVYSATKHIDGQGRCLGGAVLTNDEQFEAESLLPFLRNTGPALSPFNAWLLLKGLETLELRLMRQCDSALQLAQHLEARLGSGVLYPELPSHPQYELATKQMAAGGSVLAFELPGGKDAAFAFLDALQLFDISNNLGDAKSLATHPATTTHHSIGPVAREQLGISDGLVRLSVGLEAFADLEQDVDQALAAALQAEDK
jgi:O-succinylhomoserine sulfhydrylase